MTIINSIFNHTIGKTMGGAIYASGGDFVFFIKFNGKYDDFLKLFIVFPP